VWHTRGAGSLRRRDLSLENEFPSLGETVVEDPVRTGQTVALVHMPGTSRLKLDFDLPDGRVRSVEGADGRPSDGEPAFPLDLDGIGVLSERQGALDLCSRPKAYI
jgi:hypothetical protein